MIYQHGVASERVITATAYMLSEVKRCDDNVTRRMSNRCLNFSHIAVSDVLLISEIGMAVGEVRFAVAVAYVSISAAKLAFSIARRWILLHLHT